MFYQSSTANILRLYCTVSIIALTVAPLAAMAADDGLPSVEVHFEVIDQLAVRDPFAASPHKTAVSGEGQSKVIQPAAVPEGSPFSTTPSAPLDRKPSAKKDVKKPVKSVEKEPQPKLEVKSAEGAKLVEKLPKPVAVVPKPESPKPEIVSAKPRVKPVDESMPKVIEMPKVPAMPEAEVISPSLVTPEDEQFPDEVKSPSPALSTPDEEFAKALNAKLAPPVPEAPKVPPVPEAPKVPPVPEAPKVPPVPEAPKVSPVPEVPLAPPVVETPKADTSAKVDTKVELSVKFISTETNLPLSVEGDLKKLAARVKDSKERVTLISYASESADQATTARRVSLARVLAVRAFLIEQGVDKLSINVKAEGNKGQGGEPNRVDVILDGGK